MDFSAAKAYILNQLQHRLSPSLHYHNLSHTLDVYQAAKILAKAEKVTAADRKLLRTAALYHDAGFLRGMDNHEVNGCQLVREKLPEFGYTQDQINQICEMILATRLPQNPQSDLAEILCDADLYYLGTERFYSVGQRLFLEFKERGILQTAQEWNRLQVDFLQSHRYFTPTAQRLLNPGKFIHLAEVRRRVSGEAA